MIGGTATLAWTAAGQSGQFLFCINGNNANPDAATLLFQLGTNPWYLFQIAEQESPNGSLPGALQFNMITKSKADTAYQPVWGSPNGFGIMQIDPPLSELDVFSWTHNVADGVLLAQQQNGAAVTFWNRQVAQYKTWLQANPRTAPPPPTPDPESNCGEFVYGIPKAGQHSFSDAIGIKKYNGLGNNSLSDVNGYNYIVWQNTGAFQLKPHWTIFPYTVVQLSSGPQDIYYVSNVCSRSKTP
jgi:hypothetical protein